MGKDNSKAKEKKAERKAMEAKMNRGVANVKAANAVEDPLALLPKPFSMFNKNGLDLKLETVRAPEVPEETKVWAFDLVKTTMKPLYDAAYGDDPDMEAELGGRKRRKRRKCGHTMPGTCLLGLRRARLWLSPIFAMTWIMMTRLFIVTRSK